MDVARLSIRQYRAIAMLADHARLSQASDRLATSQSSLSRHIAAAERSLGTTIFQRGWAGMEPTAVGAIVIAQSRRMIAALSDAQRALLDGGRKPAELGVHLTWQLLEIVDAVRITGGAFAAATYLGLSQPAISRALAKVAAATGQPPFRRTRAGMAASADVAA